MKTNLKLLFCPGFLLLLIVSQNQARARPISSLQVSDWLSIELKEIDASLGLRHFRLAPFLPTPAKAVGDTQRDHDSRNPEVGRQSY